MAIHLSTDLLCERSAALGTPYERAVPTEYAPTCEGANTGMKGGIEHPDTGALMIGFAPSISSMGIVPCFSRFYRDDLLFAMPFSD